MGGSSRRRWPKRLLVAGVIASGLAALRERKLEENARRFGL